MSETSWRIVDNNNNVVASRTNAALNTDYSDTVSMPRTGFYTLKVTDEGCDGLHWWVYDQQPNLGITAGNVVVREAVSGLPMALHGNANSGTYGGDFGCGFEQRFTAIGWPLGVPVTGTTKSAGIVAYPNPATSDLKVSLYGISNVNGEISLVDAVGKTVLVQKTTSSNTNLNVKGLASGIYNVIYSDVTSGKVYSRITISK